MDENTRLSDLTRMLLSSSAFSNFLNDLSGANASKPSTEPISEVQPKIESSSSPPKDVNPHQAAQHYGQDRQQNAPLVGMAMIPEVPINLGLTEHTNNTWSDNADFSLYEAQVYSVTSLPPGPVLDQLDTGIISGKSSNVVGPYPTYDEEHIESSDGAKDQPSLIERIPAPSTPVQCDVKYLPVDDVDYDESDPSYALYAEYITSPAQITNRMQIFGDVRLEKVFGRYEVVIGEEMVDDAETAAASATKFDYLCSTMDVISARIAAVIS